MMNTPLTRRSVLQAGIAAAIASAVPAISVADIADYKPAVAGSPVPRMSAFGKRSTAEEVTAGIDLAGRTALVTGCNSGLGLETMRVLAMRGAHVIGAARTQEKAEDACASVEGRTTPLAIELTDLPGIVAAADEVAAMDTPLDMLILNAGIADDAGPAEHLDLEVLRRVFEINVFGVAQALRDGIAFMRSGGSVIVTSSPTATELMPGVAAYGASKAAVNALVRTAAIELGPRGIRVNAVLPGVIETEMAFDPENSAAELERLSALTATGKFRQPREMGPPFQFLASKASETCTGALLACEDGVSAGFSSLLFDRAFNPKQ